MGYMALRTVVETGTFIKAAATVLSEDERTRLIDYLAFDPLAGDEIRGTGGVRKVRFAIRERGKSGGARVIYFVYSAETPVYLLTCYAKNVRDNLTDAEINAYARVTAAIKAAYRKRM